MFLKPFVLGPAPYAPEPASSSAADHPARLYAADNFALSTFLAGLARAPSNPDEIDPQRYQAVDPAPPRPSAPTPADPRSLPGRRDGRSDGGSAGAGCTAPQVRGVRGNPRGEGNQIGSGPGAAQGDSFLFGRIRKVCVGRDSPLSLLRETGMRLM